MEVPLVLRKAVTTGACHALCVRRPCRSSHSVYALQYTFILTASKQLPKQCTDYQSGKSKQRKSVGVRIPDDDVLQVSILVILTSLTSNTLCIICCTLFGLTDMRSSSPGMLVCDRFG